MARSTITVEGFVSKDPETRDVTGHTITAVTIPVTPQKKDGNGGYVDNGDTVWYQAEFWDDHGQAVAQAVRKGTLVTVTGSLDVKTREKDGNTYINHLITFGTIAVVVVKPKRGQGSAVSQSQPSAEPWATDTSSNLPTPQEGAQGNWYTNDETPF